MDIKIIDIVYKVLNTYGETIRFNTERFENALNDEVNDLVDERYLVVQAMRWGYYDLMIYDDDHHNDVYIDILQNVNHLSEEEAFFIVHVLQEIIKKMNYQFIIDNMDEVCAQALESQNIFHILLCAKVYYKGFGVEQDYEKAFELYQILANMGNKEAHYYLGKMYEEGLGVEQDLSKATEHYMKTDESMSHYLLGKMYLYVDEYKAMEYFKKSKEPKAYYHLGLLYENRYRYDQAFMSYHQGAKKYNLSAMHKCALFLLEGKGVEKNIEEGLKYLRYCYYGMDGQSAYELGSLYLSDYYVKKDIKKAIHYIKQAASLNYKDACLLLGKCYEKGLYVKEDKDLSLKYYKQASLLEGGEKREDL